MQKILAIFLAMCILMFSMFGAPAWANTTTDDADSLLQAYDRAEFTQTRAKAIRKLQERGYQVHSIELQTHYGKPALVNYTSKNGVRYTVTLTYPNLKIVQERRAN
ncbi:PepSY domain-containing protein [Moraxella ovis]|uniref:PepSY domain-containing protein n=1 Tax=Moraxella ovis TaxID=29433 RepID=UPI0011BE48DB|nr:PepSY domain-containing protein [Moraxella ovis]